jgi:hypothetical protein
MITHPDSPLSEAPPARVEENHPFYTALLHVSVWLTWPLIALSVWLSATVLGQSGYAWSLPLLFAGGVLASDFTSGLFHWFFDNYGSPQTPVFGQTIELFRVHHDLPEDICNSGLVFTVGHVCLWVVPMISTFIGAWYLAGRGPLVSALLLFATMANLFLVLTNLFHKWAHLPKKPAWMLFMQEYRLVLETQHHNIHHTPPFDTYYCITTGWLNPLLRAIKFFPRMEKVLALIGVQKNQGA